MSDIEQNLATLRSELPGRVRLVAVSKTQETGRILEAYEAGQRLFGENRVQELVAKQSLLPGDIEWHLIGHLQTNKVKLIVPFISMIHSVDSFKLLAEISREALKHNRIIDCLLQIHIAREETKFGMDQPELADFLERLKRFPQPGVRIRGLMGMASFSDDTELVRREFNGIHHLFLELKDSSFSADPLFNELSTGMSGDYRIAVEEGSTLVRIGTKLFGAR